jgi:hypothetical protein
MGQEDDMPTLILDAATRDKLAALRQWTELRDESGQLLGHYVPADPVCPWEPGLSEEEIDRRIHEPGGSTLGQFWNRQTNG